MHYKKTIEIVRNMELLEKLKQRELFNAECLIINTRTTLHSKDIQILVMLSLVVTVKLEVIRRS